MGPPRPGRLTTRYRYEHTTAEARDGETCRLVATGTWVAPLLAAAPAPAPPQGQATAMSCRPWRGQAARSPCAGGGWGPARCLRPGAARSPGAHLQPGGLVSLTSSHLLGQPGGGTVPGPGAGPGGCLVGGRSVCVLTRGGPQLGVVCPRTHPVAPPPGGLIGRPLPVLSQRPRKQREAEASRPGCRPCAEPSPPRSRRPRGPAHVWGAGPVGLPRAWRRHWARPRCASGHSAPVAPSTPGRGRGRAEPPQSAASLTPAEF